MTWAMRGFVTLVAGATVGHCFQTSPHASVYRRPVLAVASSRDGAETDSSLPFSPSPRPHLITRRQWQSSALALPLALAAGGAIPARAEEEVVAAIPAPAGEAVAPASAGEAVAAPEPVAFAEGFPADATVPYKGKNLPLKKFRSKATIVCNIKTDDPESSRNLQALAYLSTKYSSKVWKGRRSSAKVAILLLS